MALLYVTVGARWASSPLLTDFDSAGEGDDVSTISASLRVRVYDCHRRKAIPAAESVPIVPGRLLVVGREGEVPVGLDPKDTGVSRRALRVDVDGSGWTVYVDNTHGAVIHPWGQAPYWHEKGSIARHRWPRLGVRLVGSERTLEHWVLLESDAFPLPRPEPADPVVAAGGTDLARPPKPLTDTQLAAVRAIFSEHLAWPPRSGPAPVPVAAAANRLKVSATAVSERLAKVQERAYALGLHQLIGVSDPEYVYRLVRHGYIPPDQAAFTP